MAKEKEIALSPPRRKPRSGVNLNGAFSFTLMTHARFTTFRTWIVALMVGLGTMGWGHALDRVLAKEVEPLRPRVPVSERSMAKQLIAPFGSTTTASPEILAEGKSLYEGKGICVSCHGETGLGDGPIGSRLNPGPRDLTNCRFHKRRTDGELFWVLKHGIPGTGMVPMIPVTITEEEAWKILAYERTFCQERSIPDTVSE